MSGKKGMGTRDPKQSVRQAAMLGLIGIRDIPVDYYDHGDHRHKKGRSTLQKVIEDVEGRDLEDILEDTEPKVLIEKYHLDSTTITVWKRRIVEGAMGGEIEG